MRYLVIGLGNIGREYHGTRHNIGFSVVDYIAKENKLKLDIGRLAFVGNFKYSGRNIFLIKPTTYVNLSGNTVNYWIKYLKIPLSNTLTITDDLSLPFETLRMRQRGSHGGHNGLKSIETALSSNQYPRLRFGIGNNFSRGRQADYVLEKFSAVEKRVLSYLINKAAEMVLSFCVVGIDHTMNKYNK